MVKRPICKSKDHMFVPILETTEPLMRCIYCDVFAYHDTVKQLAKSRGYRVDEEPVRIPPPPSIQPAWRRWWIGLLRTLRFSSSKA